MPSTKALTHEAITLDEIYDCAVLWVSADADHPDTPPQEWQDALVSIHKTLASHAGLVAALEIAEHAFEELNRHYPESYTYEEQQAHYALILAQE